MRRVRGLVTIPDLYSFRELWRRYRACRRKEPVTRNALAFEADAEALQRELRGTPGAPGPRSASSPTDRSRAMSMLRRVTANGRRPAWALRLDVASFFTSIDTRTLYRIIRRRVRDPELRWLTRVIVVHDPPRDHRFNAVGRAARASADAAPRPLSSVAHLRSLSRPCAQEPVPWRQPSRPADR